MRRFGLLLVATSLLVGGVAACGDDDDDEAAADPEAFCAVGELEAAPESGEELGELADEIERWAPPELAPAVELIADAFREAADEDDHMAALVAMGDDPDLAEALTAVDSYCFDLVGDDEDVSRNRQNDEG